MRTLLLACLLGLMASVTRAQEHTPSVTATNLENVPYPFPVRYIHLEVQGEPVQLAYMDIQPKQANGSTVVLLHGKNFCGAYWEQTAKDLSKAGFRVVIPDQLGFGKSSKPHRVQYSFQMLAANTLAILDTLGIARVQLLGHSMGGMLATRLALMYPDRVERLILENPIGLEDWKVKVPYQRVEDWYAGELKQTYATMKQYQLTFYYNNEWKPEYDRWIDIPAGWTRNIDYPRIAWNSALLYDMIFTQPVCYEFPNLKQPVLLIIGQKDRTALGKNKAPQEVQATLGNYPVLGKEAARAIPRSRLVEIAEAGHMPHISHYREFIEPLLAFLRS